MDIGLYTLKMPFRKLIATLVPLCRNIDPNVISLFIFPIGILTAFNYFVAGEIPSLYLVGILLIFIRCVVATLDGFVAVTFSKSTATGELVNRMVPELADCMLMGALVLSDSKYLQIGVFALILSWTVSFFGLIGLAAGRPIQSVGPVGQTDRLAALAIFSLLQYLSFKLHWDVDFMLAFLWWVVVGGILTVAMRCFRTLRFVKC